MIPVGDMRPTVFQVGRRGDAAGGMTQVVNGYLNWQFENVDTAFMRSRGGPHDPRSTIYALSAVFSVVRLRARRAEVVLAFHLSQGGSFLREGVLMKLASALGIACVAHLHGSSFAKFADRHPKLVTSILSAATATVVLSEETSKSVSALLPAIRPHLIENTVMPGVNNSARQQTVVFGGVVSLRKGVDVLYSAWAQVDHDGWRLLVAGPRTDAPEPGDRLLRAGVEPLGAVPHDRLMDLLEHSEIAVLPSRDEAMPMFILEAMARTNCVIATDVGGVSQLLGDGAGVIVKAGSVDGLASALQSVISDSTLRNRVKDAGARRFNERYNANIVMPRVEAIWLRALEGVS